MHPIPARYTPSPNPHTKRNRSPYHKVFLATLRAVLENRPFTKIADLPVQPFQPFQGV